MRFIPLEPDIVEEQPGVTLYRHIPENRAEQRAMLQSVADRLWRAVPVTKRISPATGLPNVPLKLLCHENGCLAYLSPARRDTWDERGRLQSTVVVSHTSGNDAFLFTDDERYPIFLSLVAPAMADADGGEARLLWEFPANLYSPEGRDSVGDGDGLPCLTLARDHPHSRGFFSHAPVTGTANRVTTVTTTAGGGAGSARAT